MIKTDFHIHSKYSQDTFLRNITPQKIFDYAFDKSGLDVLAVTDARNDFFFDIVTGNSNKNLSGIKLVDKNEEIAVFQKKGKNLYLLRGMEHHDDCGGHILQIGGKNRIIYEKKKSLIDRIKYAHDEGALAGIAHPYCIEFGGADAKTLEELSKHADFIETFNSLNDKKYNKMAEKFAKKNKYVGLTNSDDHNGKPGRACTLIDTELKGNLEKDSEEIKNSIRKGKILGHIGNYTSFLEKAYIFVAKDFLSGDPMPAIGRVKRALSSIINNGAIK